MASSVFDVARNLIKKEGGAMNTMKLQKLVFYCQAYSLVDTGHPMFPEQIEAWRHGPVVPILWQRFAGRFDACEENLDQEAAPLSPEDQKAVDAIWDTFGGLTGWELRTITHKEEPWKNSYNENEDFHNTVIDVNTMRDFYTRKWMPKKVEKAF